MRFALTAFAAILALSATALDVVFDKRTPKGNCAWVDKSHVREQMEVVAAKICKTLYDGTKDENLSDGFTLTLFPTPETKGNPGFASGKHVTWRVGTDPDYDASNGIGLLAHEMTHVFDMNAKPMSKERWSKFRDSKVIEATAVWVTDYNVKYGIKGYRKCCSPEIVLGRRYEALREHRSWGGYRAGAGFFDFVDQAYGKGTALKIIHEQTATGKNPWERVLGKTMEELEAEWRQMETIYDPVFQWNYNGTAAGAVRRDKKFCNLKTISATDSSDKAGAWLDGVTAGKVEGVDDGSITIALHGRFPRKDNVAIASLGSVKEGGGKALLLTTAIKVNTLSAHIIASVPGHGCQIVSSTTIPLSSTPTQNSNSSPVPHSVILTIRGGDTAAVIADGKPVAKIDMKTKCEGCAFKPVFAVGGVSGGFGVAGFTESRGEGGVMLDDVRVFTRTFRSKESASYAATFGPEYRGAVAVEGTWIGPSGGTDITNTDNWKLFNAYGERVVALPSKETDITVWFNCIPSIPPKSKFVCKSFTIDGIALADEADIDLRGVRIVDIADNTHIITENGHTITANAVRAKGIRLDGALAVTGGLKATGNLEMKEGSALTLPDDPTKALVRSISFKGEGPVAIAPVSKLKPGKIHKLLRIEEPPEDFARLRLNLSGDASDATFSPASGGKFIGVTPRK